MIFARRDLTSRVSGLNFKQPVNFTERSTVMKIKKIKQVAKGMCKCKQTC